MEAIIEAYVKERDEALLSMDKDKIYALIRKWDIPFPVSTEEAFWAAVHKARCCITSFPREEREKSRAWLHWRRFQIPPGGEEEAHA